MSYPFSIKVFVQKRPHMRDPNLEYLFMFGLGVLNQIFDEERVDPAITKLTLYFPERHMNIVEERSLYDRLKHFCPNLKELQIMTQSVYILQCTTREDILICESQDELDNGTPNEAVTGRLWRNNAHGYDFNKLNVFS